MGYSRLGVQKLRPLIGFGIPWTVMGVTGPASTHQPFVLQTCPLSGLLTTLGPCSLGGGINS